MTCVVIESPYAGDTDKNVQYLYRCCIDSLSRGEFPFASHGFYTQFLDDLNPEERKIGIEAGFAWWIKADKIIFYEDLGWSKGMLAALSRAKLENKLYEVRKLNVD